VWLEWAEFLATDADDRFDFGIGYARPSLMPLVGKGGMPRPETFSGERSFASSPIVNSLSNTSVIGLRGVAIPVRLGLAGKRRELRTSPSRQLYSPRE
jgi:hypothetical protein